MTAQTLTAAVADQATVKSRLAELAAVYPLPWQRCRFRPDLGNYVWLYTTGAPAVMAWAAQLGVSAKVEVYDHGGAIWRVTTAVGDILGWRIFVNEQLPPNWPAPRPVAGSPLLRAARGGWL